LNLIFLKKKSVRPINHKWTLIWKQFFYQDGQDKKDNKDIDWKNTKSNGNLKDQVYEMVNQYLEVIDIDIDCEIFEKLWDQQLSEFILIISSEVKTKKYVDLKERLEKIGKN